MRHTLCAAISPCRSRRCPHRAPRPLLQPAGPGCRRAVATDVAAEVLCIELPNVFGRVEQRFRAQLNRARSTSSDIPSGGNGSTRDGDADALVSANRAEVGVAMATGEAAGGGAVAACGVLGGLGRCGLFLRGGMAARGPTRRRRPVGFGTDWSALRPTPSPKPVLSSLFR